RNPSHEISALECRLMRRLLGKPSTNVLPAPCQDVAFRNADGNDPVKQSLVLLSRRRREPQACAFRPAQKQNGFVILLLDPARDLIEVRGNLIRGHYRFARKALKIVQNIQAIGVISRFHQALRDCDSEAAATCIPRSKQDFVMMSCNCSLIQVNPLFLPADRKSILATLRALRKNAGVKRDYNDNAILYSNKRAHGLLLVSVWWLRPTRDSRSLISERRTSARATRGSCRRFL